MEEWIKTIGLATLVSAAPSGMLIGCGGTSLYITHVMRNKLNRDDLLIFSRSKFTRSKCIDTVKFFPYQLDEILDLIDKRLLERGYVRVSFNIETSEETVPSDRPYLFDHSFVLFRNKTIFRIESYLGKYETRCVSWNSYSKDIRAIMKSPLRKWRKIFGVKCRPDYDINKVTIFVEN